jgi:hypothetical protein
MPLISNL